MSKIYLTKNDNWVGREIEYRNDSDLLEDSIVYRGRIVSMRLANPRYCLIDDGPKYEHEVIVKPTYITTFPIKKYHNGKKRNILYNSYRKDGRKFQWEEFETDQLHVVKWCGNRWKKLDFNHTPKLIEYIYAENIEYKDCWDRKDGNVCVYKDNGFSWCGARVNFQTDRYLKSEEDYLELIDVCKMTICRDCNYNLNDIKIRNENKFE